MPLSYQLLLFPLPVSLQYLGGRGGSNLMFAQSAGWLWFHSCSASAEELKSACLTVPLCFSMHCCSLCPICLVYMYMYMYMYMYKLGQQLAQGILYTTPDRCKCGVVLIDPSCSREIRMSKKEVHQSHLLLILRLFTPSWYCTSA